jgi:hypothetical protein
MTKKRETRRQRRMRAALEETFGGKWWKVHGGPFQEAGIPDLNGCVDGLYIAIEVKEEDGTLAEIQERRILEFEKAGAITFAESSIRRTLTRVAEAILVSAAGCKVRARARRFLSVSRAESGEDLRNSSGNRAAKSSKLAGLDNRTKSQQDKHVVKAVKAKSARRGSLP